MFDRIDALIAEIEGLHANQAGDAGGDTWYGIAHYFHPLEPWPPTPERAREIRQMEYFNSAGCMDMPWEAAVVVYDMAIQSGAKSAVLVTQAILGVKQDGYFGPASERAMRSFVEHNPGAFVVEIQSRRILNYAKQTLWATDGLGWMHRLVKVVMLAARGEQ